MPQQSDAERLERLKKTRLKNACKRERWAREAFMAAKQLVYDWERIVEGKRTGDTLLDRTMSELQTAQAVVHKMERENAGLAIDIDVIEHPEGYMRDPA